MKAVELRRALQAAVTDAPPTGIDLDRLIGAEQRRERSLRNAGLICAAVVGVLTVTIAYFGLSAWPAGGQQVAGPGPAQPVAGPVRPCPSLPATGAAHPYQSGVPSHSSSRSTGETCGEATARLDEALATALHTQAAGVSFQDVFRTGQPVRFLYANDDNLTYDAGLLLTTPTGRGSLDIQIQDLPPGSKPEGEAEWRKHLGCDRTPASDTTCIYRTDSDGTVVTGVLVPAPMSRGGRQYQIQVFRTDHTLVMLTVSNTYYQGTPDPRATQKVGGDQLPLTLDQIIAIGQDPGLTLYP
jgi:hypothetical protein